MAAGASRARGTTPTTVFAGGDRARKGSPDPRLKTGPPAAPTARADLMGALSIGGRRTVGSAGQGSPRGALHRRPAEAVAPAGEARAGDGAADAPRSLCSRE